MIDRGNLMKFLKMRCNKFALNMEMLFSTEMRIPQGTEGYFVIDHGNLIISTLKNRQIQEIAWEVMQQKL